MAAGLLQLLKYQSEISAIISLAFGHVCLLLSALDQCFSVWCQLWY